MLIFILTGSFVLVSALTILYFAKSKPKIHAIEQVVSDSASNLFHIFGYTMYMPDDSPSFDIYRHYVFDLSNYQFTAGDHQQAKGFDIDSPFVEGSIETLSNKMGIKLQLEHDKEIRSEIKVIRRDLNATDTQVIEKIPKDALVVTKLRTNELGFSKVSLELYRGGINMGLRVFKGWAENDFQIYKTPSLNEVILIYSKGRTNHGMALAVIDLTTGNFLFDQFITAKR